MQLINDGPDIPNEVLQALEEERLVLFCGAGVSYRAGLQNFKWLVDRVYDDLNEKKSVLEEEEYRQRRFDLVLELLEQRQSKFVRESVIRALTLKNNANLQTHLALIRLAKTKNDACQLVTTNFDAGFLRHTDKENIIIHSAPLLPIPKPTKWKSIVHLHGLICPDNAEGEDLVLTSKDFGSAYLVDGYATRFVIELFRNYIVLFIGYSADDPILRYLLDALAADRALGIGINKAFAFAGCDSNKKDEEKINWEGKGITPILYNNKEEHTLLHETLIAWSTVHTNRVYGKESIIKRFANVNPTNNYIASQIIWAIGQGYKRENGKEIVDTFGVELFIKEKNEYLTEWLDEFYKKGLLSLAVKNESQELIGNSTKIVFGSNSLNPVTFHLGTWLAKHLDKREVLNWVIKKGCNIHPDIKAHMRYELISNRQASEKITSPIERILLSDTYKIVTNENNIDTRISLHRLKNEIFNCILKKEFLESLTPQILLIPGYHKSGQSEQRNPIANIVLSNADNIASILEELQLHDYEKYKQVLLSIPFELAELLLQAMDIMHLFGRASDKYDESQFILSSISENDKITKHDSVGYLIELQRDSFKILLKENYNKACILVQYWKTLKYPLFRRLVFYAMNTSDLFSPNVCLDYLLEDNGWWIWSCSVMREAFFLQRTLWPKLTKRKRAQLIDTILLGPEQKDYSGNDWVRDKDIMIGIRLKKLYRIDQNLSSKAIKKLNQLELISSIPESTVDDRDELPFYMTSYIGYESNITLEEMNRLKRDQIVDVLIRKSDKREGLIYVWLQFVKINPKRALTVLLILAKNKKWHSDIWNSAFNGFSAIKTNIRIWRCLSKALIGTPGNIFHDCLRPLALWLCEISATLLVSDENNFWELWDELIKIALNHHVGDITDPVTEFLNHPAGILTYALIYILWSREPKPDSKIPPDLIERLTNLINCKSEACIVSRIRLASYLNLLYAIDKEWSCKYLLPHFDWDKNAQSHLLWQSFIWQLQITPGLFSQLKINFLKAIRNKEKLARFKEQVCQLFTMCNFEITNAFTLDEVKDLLATLDEEGLSQVAHTLYQLIHAAGEKSGNYWRDKVTPWLRSVWPKDVNKKSTKCSRYLALAAIFSNEAFPEAVKLIEHYIIKINDCLNIPNALINSLQVDEYPTEALDLLYLTVSTDCNPFGSQLREALDRIKESNPRLKKSKCYKKLDEYLKSHNK